MPTVSFDISADNLTRVIDAYCGINGYTDTIEDPLNPGEQIPNPVTRQQFTRQMIIALAFKEPVHNWEKRLAVKSAVEAIVIPDVPIT